MSLIRLDLPDGTVIKYSPRYAAFVKEAGGVKAAEIQFPIKVAKPKLKVVNDA